MKKYCLYFLLVLSASVHAQELAIEWSNVYGGTSGEAPVAVLESTDSCYIVLALSESSDIDVSTNNGNGDFWVFKLDRSGNILWEYSYGGSDLDVPRRICHTHDGGYLLTGFTQSNDGDISFYHGGVDAWLVKLDANGILEWEKTYGGGNGESAFDIIPTSEGGYIFCGGAGAADGDVGNNYGLGDVWIVKIDSTGAIEWENNYGGTGSDYGKRIVQIDDNGYFIAGSVNSTDLDVSMALGNYDYWGLRIDAGGTIIWERSYGTTDYDQFSDMIKTSDSTFLILASPGAWDVDVTDHIGGDDIWMVHLDQNGEILWDKAFGGTAHDYPSAIMNANDGGYGLFGWTQSSDGDVSNNLGFADMWAVKLDANFEVVAERCVGNQQTNICSTGMITSDLSLLILGSANWVGGDIDTIYGSQDIWIVKLIDEAGTDELTSGIRIFPNPTSSFITIQGVSNSASSYSIVDQLGRVVQFGDLNQNLQIDVSEISEGLYYLQIEEFATAILIE